jgi:hypothetical protein
VAVDERRLTPTERLHEVTMAAMGRRPAEPESSVTITRNAKGVFQFEVTVRGPNEHMCAVEARTIVRDLIDHYPYPVETPFGAGNPE